MKKHLSEEAWMSRAIALARHGLGQTRPNPPVGAIIVRNGRAVGQGWHRRAGTDHAEIVALKDAGRRARGATLYVTLEPCSTSGKTPPCTSAILANGVTRVVIATRDPNPRHNGRGIGILRRAGVHVTEGVREEEGRALVAPFSKWVTTGMPYVTLKLGTSIDGRISDLNGKSRWITSEESRSLVKKLRGEVDAVLVGSATALLDNPSLLPAECSRSKPFRIVVSARGGLLLSNKIFSDGKSAQTIIATTRRCPSPVADALGRTGAAIWHLPEKHGRVSLKPLLAEMGRRGILHVLCEGGGALAESMVREGLVDEVLFIVAPLILGGTTSTAAIGGHGWQLALAPKLEFTDVRRIGADILVRGKCRG
ncbi:MAG: bifunctional diaminohydroxyphosphoribosylaminopyrimidine deaminase/5-amino-6-(5-phosphoribosylamino)uracil reductase RibD [bacterium]